MPETVTIPAKRVSGFRRAERHIRNRLLSGVFVLVPLGITVLVIRIIANAMALFIRPFVKLLLGPINPTVEMAISVSVFVVVVYLVGLITTHIVGRRMVAMGESLILRIPLVKSIYAATKQVVSSISVSHRSTFKSVVLVEFPRPGVRTLGFVTGTEAGRDGRPVQRVFVPTAPNPTTGFLLFVSEGQFEPTRLSVEDAVKMVVSGGVLGADGAPAQAAGADSGPAA